MEHSTTHIHVHDHDHHGVMNMTTAVPDEHIHHDHDLHQHIDPLSTMEDNSQHQMYKGFFSTSTSAVLLFDGWSSASSVGLLMGVVLAVVATLSLEGLKVHSYARKLWFQLKTPCAVMPVRERLLASVLNMLEASFSYVIMLLVMTFNIFIIIAVVIGAGLGHFVIRPLLLRRVRNKMRSRRRIMRVLTAPKPILLESDENEGEHRVKDGHEEQAEGCCLDGHEEQAEGCCLDGHEEQAEGCCLQNGHKQTPVTAFVKVHGCYSDDNDKLDGVVETLKDCCSGKADEGRTKLTKGESEGAKRMSDEKGTYDEKEKNDDEGNKDDGDNDECTECDPDLQCQIVLLNGKETPL